MLIVPSQKAERYHVRSRPRLRHITVTVISSTTDNSHYVIVIVVTVIIKWTNHQNNLTSTSHRFITIARFSRYITIIIFSSELLSTHASPHLQHNVFSTRLLLYYYFPEFSKLRFASFLALFPSRTWTVHRSISQAISIYVFHRFHVLQN